VARPKFVQIPPHPLDRFEPLLGDDYGGIEATAARARDALQGRAIWHVSSTMRGGGVAEMLRTMLPYARGAGIDTRWVVLRERTEFFELTKRLHNNLHGDRGDGGPLGPEERELYERTLAGSARHLSPLLQPGDVAFLHDPQTAGLAPAAKAAGASVIWRCHVGADRADETTRRAWDFLSPYVRTADAYVFSRREYVWEPLDRDRAWTMAPAIDPFSSKNQDLDPATVEDVVGVIGLGPRSPRVAPTFTRADSTPGRIERRAEVTQEDRLPEGAQVIAQISRWDRLKDHRGLLECFGRHLGEEAVHLVLAGPATAAVADDPEGAAVLEGVRAAWRELPAAVRSRTHLVSLPMDDLDENWAMVNALQRRADVVVQKSLAEGFGLTVAEAMWKRKPVIGTRVGGIQDQIVDGVSGTLIEDPRDLAELAGAILDLIGDPGRAAQIGEAARQRVLDRFLAVNRLTEYAALVTGLPMHAMRGNTRTGS
jgi:trehalose synthase